MEHLHYLHKASEEPSEDCIVLLHGYGSSEEDLFGFARYLPKHLTVFSLRAPYSTGFSGFAWYAITFEADGTKWNDIKQAEDSVKRIKTEIDLLRNKYNLTGKVHLLGFSQGCILSLALSYHYPYSFYSIIGLSGYLNEEILPSEIKSLPNTYFYLSHGTEDQVIPVEWSQHSAEKMKRQGLNVDYHNYPTGHQVHPDNFRDFLSFINSHS
jgi:phospholipase/carboxylesterase